MSYTEWIVEESGARLDKYLSEVSELSRTRVQDLAKEKKIFVNGKAEKSSHVRTLSTLFSIRYPLFLAFLVMFQSNLEVVQ